MINFFDKNRNNLTNKYGKILRDYNALLGLNNKELIALCIKMRSNEPILRIAKKDFSRVEDIINYIVESHIDNSIVTYNLFLGLLETNEKDTMAYLIRKNKHSGDIQTLIDKGDNDKLAELLSKKADTTFFEQVASQTPLYKSFVYTLAYIKKNPKVGILSSKSKSPCYFNSKELAIILSQVRDKLKLTQLPRDYLKNEKVLRSYVDNEKEIKVITNFINELQYLKSSEKNLLSILGSEYSSLEDVIIDMHKKGIKREDMNIYQILAIEMYAKKRINAFKDEKVMVNMFSNTDKRGTCSYSYSEKKYSIDISMCLEKVKTVEQIIRVLEHEIYHVIQAINIKEMNIDIDEDIDLYSKDYFIRNMAMDFFDSMDYYDFNYGYISDEYMAESVAIIETQKLLYNKKLCLQKCKDDLSFPEKNIFDRTTYRFMWNKYNLNELVENELEREIEHRGVEIIASRIQESIPILLLEYDIYKGKGPRRKSLDQLVEMYYKTDDDKLKRVYLGLLISRFSEFKEKKEDVEKNISYLEKMIKYNAIDQNLANILLGSIRRDNKNQNADRRRAL